MLATTYAGAPSPCYILEETKLLQNLRLIQHIAQTAHVEFILAFKAFALWRSFPSFRPYIQHTTASSPYEALLALQEFGSRAHTYSPAYEDSTFDTILACSSHISFNSLTQYAAFGARVHQYNAQHEAPIISCGLRINPEYSSIQTALYNPTAPGSRFGILATDLPPTLPPGIEGLHCHNHCESTSYDLEKTLQAIEERFGPYLSQVRWLNLGGGHLVTRQDYDVPHLIHLLQDFQQRHPGLRLILEPGSAFAWQTGSLLAHVVDIVSNHGIKTAILNVSFTCHMPDCLEMPYQPTVRHALTLPDDAAHSHLHQQPTVYRLGGNSCLSGDYMGYWQFEQPLHVGDSIIFEDMIHYTTVKTCMFNGIQHPSIGMLHRDGHFELYRTYTYADYRDRMC